MTMKRSLLSLLLIVAATSAQARTETFRWLDPNPLPSPVVAFKVYMGPGPGNYITILDVGLPTPDGDGIYSFSADVPDGNTVYVAMTATDIENLESSFSNEQIRLATIPTPTPLPTPTPAPGPLPMPTVAHWKFDEGSGLIANDVSGSGHTGNIVGALWTSDLQGISLSFDGIDDSVDVGSVDVSGQSMTIALWFNADSFDVGDARLISKATGVNPSEHIWMLSTINSGGVKLRFRLKAGGSTSTLIATGPALLAGVWTQAAIVYDGSGMHVYKDGLRVGSTSKSGPIDTDPTVGVAIGNQPDGAGTRPFEGAIQDVRIYSEALTDSQIMQLFQAGTEVPSQPLPPFLVSPI
jgi:hypothetical protein